MNRFEQQLQASNGILNGRRWTSYRRGDARGFEVSELHPSGQGFVRYFPGHWDGKSHNAAAFSLLDKAAGHRFTAAALPSLDWRRPIFLSRAREAIADSRERTEEQRACPRPECFGTTARQSALRCPHFPDCDHEEAA